MSLEKFIDACAEFCLDGSGPAGDLIKKITSDKPENHGPVFFKPYQSTGDFFKRTVSVVTAPIFLSVVALEIVALALVESALAFKDLFFDTSNAWETAKGAFSLFLAATCMAIYAIASPITNLVDLVGGGIKSLTQDEPTQDEPTEELDSSVSMSVQYQ